MVCPRHLRSRPVVRQPTSSAHALDPDQTRLGSRVHINGMRCNRLPLRERRSDLLCLAAEPVARIRRFLLASAYESNFALRLSVQLAFGKRAGYGRNSALSCPDATARRPDHGVT